MKFINKQVRNLAPQKVALDKVYEVYKKNVNLYFKLLKKNVTIKQK